MLFQSFGQCRGTLQVEYERYFREFPPLLDRDRGALRPYEVFGQVESVGTAVENLQHINERAFGFFTYVNREDGYRQVLGIAEGHSADRAGWSGFLQHLKNRGLTGARLIVSDVRLGLVEASGLLGLAGVDRRRRSA